MVRQVADRLMEKFVRLIGKNLVPRFIIEAVRCVRKIRSGLRSPFAGVYERFADVPRAGGGFNDDDWINTSIKYSKSLMERNAAGFVPVDVVGEKALLPVLVSTLANRGPIRIVDFGGSTGFSYLAVRGAVPDARVDYVVVERPGICKAGRALFGDDSQIRFLEEIPDNAARTDVVVVGASLQYIDNYRGHLANLANLKPEYILFTKMPAGENPTYATAQVNLKNSKQPTWMFSVREIVSIMKDLNYRLVFRGAVEGEINQQAFDPVYRVGRFCNLLFSRNQA